MKVLILVHTLGRGGAQKQAGLLCKNLNDANVPCEIILVSPPPAFRNRIIGNRIEQPDIFRYIKFTFPYFDPSYRPLIWRKNIFKGFWSIVENWKIHKRKRDSLAQILAQNYTWIIPFSPMTTYIALELCALDSGLSMFYNSRGGSKIVKSGFLLESVQMLGTRFHIMANSNIGLHTSLEFFKKEYGILLRNFVVNTSVNTAQINGTKSLIHVANYFPEKDFDTLLRGYKAFLSQSNESVKLIIYCKFFRPHQLRRFQILIEKLNLKKQIILHYKGENPNDDIAGATVGLLSTVSEGCSNTLLEYMSYSLPILTTNIEANVELLGKEYSSFLFEAQNEVDFANKLSFLLNSPETLTSARNIVKSRYEEFLQNDTFEKFISYLYKYQVQI
jgi:glycosyltransferase involved in cell wall biosynthesis